MMLHRHQERDIPQEMTMLKDVTPRAAENVGNSVPQNVTTVSAKPDAMDGTVQKKRVGRPKKEV